VAQGATCLLADISLRQCPPSECRRAEQQPKAQASSSAAAAGSSAAADQAACTLLQAAALSVVQAENGGDDTQHLPWAGPITLKMTTCMRSPHTPLYTNDNAQRWR
jgi:hypothetical protein